MRMVAAVFTISVALKEVSKTQPLSIAGCALSEKSGEKMGWPFPLRLEESEPIEMRAPRAVTDR